MGGILRCAQDDSHSEPKAKNLKQPNAMKTFYSDTPLDYDGTQLHSHFAYQNFQILGDSIVAFQGGANVELHHMVDREDVLQKRPIFSESMLHFVVEHFTDNFFWAIACQRLLITNIQQDLESCVEGLQLRREGDDLFDDSAKLTVSICTRSPVSCLIHTGLNISSKNTPVLTKGLEDYQITPESVATSVMNRYRAEIQGLQKARAKVRGVS